MSLLRGVLAERRIISSSRELTEVLTQEFEALFGAAPRFAFQISPTVSGAFEPPSELIMLVADNPIHLGWAFQFWNEPERDDATWGISRLGENVGMRSVAKATQVFTEDYMARFLLARCASQSQGIPSFLDPACGTGHLLVHAARQLGNEPGRNPLTILSALHGCDIDGDAVEVCRIVMLLELARTGSAPLREIWKAIQAQFQTVERAYGSLERSSAPGMLCREYACVLTNPPYIGRRKMTEEMRAFLDVEYPDTRMDLCSAFMQRCVELVAPGGMIGLVTVDKWLRLKGYETLRTGGQSFGGLYKTLELDVVCELGARAFSSWSNLHDGVGTMLLTARRQEPKRDHVFHFISSGECRHPLEKEKFLREWLHSGEGGQRVAQHSVHDARSSTAFVVQSGLPQGLASSRRTVGDIARVVVGLQTSDDRRYVRYVWSVPPDKTSWLVHGKGGGYERWYGLNHFLLDWRAGRPVFQRDPKSGLSVERWFPEVGWTYTWFANGALGLRRKEGGWSFGRAASSALFCNDSRLPAFLNSRVASLAVRRQGGKAQLPEGVVRSLPIPDSLEAIDPSLVLAAVELKRLLVEQDITDATYRPGAIFDPQRTLRLQALLLVVEGELEHQANACLALSDGERRSLDSVFGQPVAWNSCARGMECEDVWSCAPSGLLPLRFSVDIPRHARVSSAAAREQVERFFESRGGAVVAYRGLPAASLIERICRWSGLHPFDVEHALSSLLGSNLSVRREVIAPLLRSKVVSEVLSLLGHQWWSNTEQYDPSLHATLSTAELADRIRDRLPGINFLDVLGEQLESWLVTGVERCQKKLMGNTPLLAVSRGARSRDMMLSHAWSMPGTIARLVAGA